MSSGYGFNLSVVARVDVHQSEMARELTLVFGYQSPFGEFFSLWALNIETANFIAA